MQVVLLGAGNVAQVLGRKMVAAGHSVSQVFSRRTAPAFAEEIGAVAITDFSELHTAADVYLLAVNDGALATVAAHLPKVKGVIAHTAGALPMEILAVTGSPYGVLYPLQSLRKEKKDYGEIPLLLDGNTADTKDILLQFAQTIGSQVAMANDAYRLKLHTAAVVVSNFTNHLYALAEDFCRKENTDFRLLQPLMEEVTTRMRQYSPAAMQTGPAVRGDEATIYRHLQVLENHPQLQHIYQVMTQSIQLTMNNE
jgi:predicted short-subunit dehydrogenase-like oxidoreductase (DUF2520 family)